jgi:hypothetical protein
MIKEKKLLHHRMTHYVKLDQKKLFNFDCFFNGFLIKKHVMQYVNALKRIENRNLHFQKFHLE